MHLRFGRLPADGLAANAEHGAPRVHAVRLRRFASPGRCRRRSLVAAGVVAVFVVCQLAPSPARAQEGCQGAYEGPTATGVPVAEAAVLCLVNRQRRWHRLPGLRPDATLRALASQHSRDMVLRRYFGHTSPRGRTYLARVMAARWIHPGRWWHVGENLSWGTGVLATPTSVVARWMRSPKHRNNILRRDFRLAGVGVARGVPFTHPLPGATYTMDFGVH